MLSFYLFTILYFYLLILLAHLHGGHLVYTLPKFATQDFIITTLPYTQQVLPI